MRRINCWLFGEREVDGPVIWMCGTRPDCNGCQWERKSYQEERNDKDGIG